MDVTDLRVYKQSLSAFLLIEKIAVKLPRELLDIKKQILRSARAVAPLIAEGFGRKSSQKELRRFLIQAMSTSDETVTHLRTIFKSMFNNVPLEDLRIAAKEYKSISKQLNSFVSSVKSDL